MRLLSCRLSHVRQHRDLRLSFDPQLTLIGGANEAGKSTLVDALHKALFLKASATGRGVEEMRSRVHAGLPEVEIAFEAGGLSWQLRKRFSGGSGTCQLSAAGGPNLRGQEAEEQLAALLGMAGPLEGRRIGQLPERWAHLWVRQGESGRHPLEGQGDRYDLQRLLQQLQQRSSATALLSALDQRVNEQIRGQLAGLFTATGRVKAGSPLALAQERVRQAAAALAAAQQRLEELEDTMETWRQVGERLQTLERTDRPALQARLRRQAEERSACQALEAELKLQQAALEPLQQRLGSLRQQEQQLRGLISQQQSQERERETLQQQLQVGQQELNALQASVREQQLQLERGRQQQLELQQRLELAQLLLDQQQLERDAAQLTEHRHRFQQLQLEATEVKQALAALPVIGADDVRRLRTAEQRLARAEGRQEALATRITLLAANQEVRLGGQALASGEERLLLEAAELQVGRGVQLRISPGGGEAAGAAEAEHRQAAEAWHALCQALTVDTCEAAEAIERRRRDLEGQLDQLRKAASSIPWSRLEQEDTAIGERRQRLEAALQPLQRLHAELSRAGDLPADRSGLEHWLSALRSTSHSQQQVLAGGEQTLQRQRQQLEAREGIASQERQRLEQLAGSLQTLGERRQLLETDHGRPEQLTAEIAALERQLADGEAQVAQTAARWTAQRSAETAPIGTTIQEQLERLEAERETLFVRRGQLEQRCAQLGAEDPTAALESCRAALESAEADCREIECEGEAWRLLQNLFDAAQHDLADRYSAPLNEAIASYLSELGRRDQRSLLRFDPARGFENLELQQGTQSFRFEELSGGMREQLAAALRLALAEVLQPAYDGVLPLIFDDAFTNTDPERLEGLQTMLRLGLSQGIQIILLSCQPQAYTNLTAEIGSRWEINSAGATPMPAGAR